VHVASETKDSVFWLAQMTVFVMTLRNFSPFVATKCHLRWSKTWIVDTSIDNTKETGPYCQCTGGVRYMPGVDRAETGWAERELEIHEARLQLY